MNEARHSAPTTVAATALRHEGRNLSLQSRRTRGLAELLERRPELRGVGTWTEHIAESVLWSA